MPANVELITHALLTATQTGMTVLVVDSSFDLLRQLCSRLYAMDRGVLIGTYRPGDFSSPDELAATMLGGGAASDVAEPDPAPAAERPGRRLVAGAGRGRAGAAVRRAAHHQLRPGRLLHAGRLRRLVPPGRHPQLLPERGARHAAGRRPRRAAAGGDHLAAAAALAGADPAGDARPEPDPRAGRDQLPGRRHQARPAAAEAGRAARPGPATRPTTWSSSPRAWASWSSATSRCSTPGTASGCGRWPRTGRWRPRWACRCRASTSWRSWSSSGLAALAGGLLLPLTSVYPTVGADVILNAFIVVVAGGLGNFRGAAIVSLLVGEVQSLGSLVPEASRRCEVVLFGLVILLLMVALAPAALCWCACERAARARSARRSLLVGLHGHRAAADRRLPGAGADQLPDLRPAGAGGRADHRLRSAVQPRRRAPTSASAPTPSPILTHHGVTNPFVLLGAALVAGLLVALLFAFYALVASGIEYLMLTFLTTLAFAALPLATLDLTGGDNGLTRRWAACRRLVRAEPAGRQRLLLVRAGRRRRWCTLAVLVRPGLADRQGDPGDRPQPVARRGDGLQRAALPRRADALRQPDRLARRLAVRAADDRSCSSTCSAWQLDQRPGLRADRRRRHDSRSAPRRGRAARADRSAQPRQHASRRCTSASC